MKYKKDGRVYVVVVEKDEPLPDTLISYFNQEEITSCYLHGIGAIRDFELGYYYLDQKKYKRQRFSEIVELLSCSGNLAIKEGNPFLHLHAVLGRDDYSLFGGHLFSAIVAVTAEFFIFPMKEEIHRTYDETTGLFLLDLPVGKTL